MIAFTARNNSFPIIDVSTGCFSYTNTCVESKSTKKINVLGRHRKLITALLTEYYTHLAHLRNSVIITLLMCCL